MTVASDDWVDAYAALVQLMWQKMHCTFQKYFPERMEQYCPVSMFIILNNKKSPNGFVLFYYVNSKSIPYLRKDPSPDVSFHTFVARNLQADILLTVLQRPYL